MVDHFKTNPVQAISASVTQSVKLYCANMVFNRSKYLNLHVFCGLFSCKRSKHTQSTIPIWNNKKVGLYLVPNSLITTTNTNTVCAVSYSEQFSEGYMVPTRKFFMLIFFKNFYLAPYTKQLNPVIQRSIQIVAES